MEHFEEIEIEEIVIGVSSKCTTCGSVYDTTVDETCPMCAYKTTMAAQAASSVMPPSGAQVRRVKTAVHSDPLVLAELKRQTAMLKTIRGMLISLSLVIALGLIFGAVALA